MKLLGLIGFPLSHSFSEKYFTEKFEKEGISDFEYKLFPISNIEKFPDLLKANPNFVGLNVTIPYKLEVMQYLDEIEESAKEVGAVNCIKFENGRLKGWNTDVYGFEKSLKELLNLPPNPLKRELASAENLSPIALTSASPPFRGLGGKPHALVLGTGGASKAVIYVLKKMDIDFKTVSRSPEKGDLIYADISDEILKTHQIIINTTPLGMSPNYDTCPNLNYEILGSEHYFYDLVYNPLKTLFLKKGENQGAKTCNGLQMLYLQAEKGWEIWNS